MDRKKDAKVTIQDKDLKNRTTLAFTDKNTGTFATEYMSGIRSNWKQTEEKARGPILSLILLVIVFILLQNSSIQEINIGPIKIGDLSFIQKIIPVIISYYFYSLANIVLMISTYKIIHYNVMQKYFPSITKNDIEKFLTPPYFSIFGDNTFLPEKYRFYSLIKKMQLVFGHIVIFGPILFQIYAFIRLFNMFGSYDLLIWSSLLVSIYLLIMGLLIMPANSKI